MEILEGAIMRPPAGLCLPVRYIRCRDGDTVEVSLPRSMYIHSIRLLDCWCPELKEPGGSEAKEFSESVLQDCDNLHVFIPIDSPGVNILKSLASFDRILGILWVSQTQTLNDLLIDAGHATRTKRDKKIW